ncbi:hypothetical protein PHIN7_13430 [Polynucleobacter sp. HIN7]|nr:hypothetical protein PHIN7_13430 [Polynucleobacter sp. HIN7]
MAPVLLILPPTVFVPVPESVRYARGVMPPIATVLTVPLPAATVKPNALLTSPSVTFPLTELVVMVRSAEKVEEREVPLKSTLPATTRSPLSVLTPVPARESPVSGVVPPIVPKVIEPLPLLMVKPNDPSIVDKVIVPFDVEVSMRSDPVKVTDPI